MDRAAEFLSPIGMGELLALQATRSEIRGLCFWRKKLVCDSYLQMYNKFDILDCRRRTKLIEVLAEVPVSAWRAVMTRAQSFSFRMCCDVTCQ